MLEHDRPGECGKLHKGEEYYGVGVLILCTIDVEPMVMVLMDVVAENA